MKTRLVLLVFLVVLVLQSRDLLLQFGGEPAEAQYQLLGAAPLFHQLLVALVGLLESLCPPAPPVAARAASCRGWASSPSTSPSTDGSSICTATPTPVPDCRTAATDAWPAATG
ncbi:hypothetical protein ACWGJX_39890 [Streptomyces sp. NPDC054775]